MKTALITGAARRIGAAIATDLAKNGYNIGIQYASSETEAEELAETLRCHGVKTVALEANLLVADDCVLLFKKAREYLGPVNVLVNNASIFENDTVHDAGNELFENHFKVHVKAPSLLASALAEQSEPDEGLIVNIIDQRVLKPNPEFYSYTLSKSALWTATKTLAQSLAPRVRVNAIGPGPTLPNARQIRKHFQAQLDGLLLKRGPELYEFGATIRYLHQARSVTGQMIALDGGQHLAWETPDIAGIPE